MTLSDAEFQANHEALYSILLTAMDARARFEALAQHDEARLMNVAQFAILFNLDLSCLLRDLNAPRAAWHIKLHARHLVVTMFECSNDFLSLLGKDFRALVAARTQDPAVLDELKRLNRQLRALQRQHPRFKEIRNSVSAHREHNAMTQVDVLLAIEPKDVERAAYQVLDWLSDFHGFIVKLLGIKSAPAASGSSAA